MNSRNCHEKPEMNQACPSGDLLRRFVDGTAAPDEEALVERHLDRCQACGQQVDALARGLEPGETLRKPPPEDSNADWEAIQAAGIPPLPQGQSQPDAVVLADGLRLAPPREPQYMARLGRFDVIEVLARGGMGTILRVWDGPLHREVALKVISPRWAEDPVARQRFLQEARAAASLRHDNIITIHDVDQDGNVPFIVMELLPGKSLALAIAEAGQFAPNLAARLVRQVLAALQHAHACGIIHRDIKPANVVLEPSGQRIKLLDFGLSRCVQDAVRYTATGTTLGTLWYMAPEQIAGLADADARSDVYSTGILLFELLTGTVPFPGRDVACVFQQIRQQPLPELRQFDPAIPEALARIVRRATEKTPAARFPTAADFAQALDEFLTGDSDARPKRQEPPAVAGAKHGDFPRCAVCAEQIVSRLSVAGVCAAAGCERPICARCFKIRGARYCPEHEPKAPEPLPAFAAAVPRPATRPPVPVPPALQASDQLPPTEPFVPPPAGPAAVPAQAQSPLDRPSTPASAGDVQPPPEAPSLEAANAQCGIAAGQACLAEQTFLRIVENVLQTIREIRDPLRQVELRPGDWRKLRTQTHAPRAPQPAARGGLAADDLPAPCPRRAGVRYDIRQRNLTGGVRGHVVVEAVNLARVERFAADGCDTGPFTQMELESFLNTAAGRAADADAWHLLILASPTGWTAEAGDFATGQGPRPFRDRAVSVVLYDAAEGRFLFDPLDERLRRLRDAFSADLDQATFQAACDFAREHLMLNESLGLETLVRQLGLGRRVAERIFRLLAASDQFSVVEMDETRHQVLVSQQGSPVR